MIVVHNSALKHGLTEEDVKSAWIGVQEYRRIKQDKYPPHYMAVGFLSNGKSVEMVAYSDGLDWHVFNAMSPITRNFKRVYEKEAGM